METNPDLKPSTKLVTQPYCAVQIGNPNLPVKTVALFFDLRVFIQE